MAMHRPAGTIEQSGGCVYALWTERGPAVFATSDDLIAARDRGTATSTEEDREYYESREMRVPWHEITLD